MRPFTANFLLLLSYVSLSSAVVLPDNFIPSPKVYATQASSVITTSATDVQGKSFDYVVVGGGAAGLVVASRLAEDPSKKVVVLEAGNNHMDDPLIQVPFGERSVYGDPEYDWLFETVPQPKANNNSIPFTRGKILGGTAAINAMVWDRSAKVEYDNIAKLGNPGWDWNSLLPFMKKPEHFTPAEPEFAAKWNLTFEQSFRGENGPLSITFSNFIPDSELPHEAAALESGFGVIKEPMGGNITGAWKGSNSIDPVTRTRAYSVSYLTAAQAAGRRNLLVLTGAHVTKINWANQHGHRDDNSTSTNSTVTPAASSKPGTVTASGVEFVVNGTPYSVSAKHEVVLSASSVGSPALLELSGVGDKNRLAKLGIQPVVDLPGVGENMQEHFYVIQSFVAKNQSITLDAVTVNQTFFSEAESTWHKRPATGPLGYVANGITMVPLHFVLPDWQNLLNETASEVATRNRTSGQEKQEKLQLQHLSNPTSSVAELLTQGVHLTTDKADPTKGYVSFLTLLQQPFSRGSTHIVSKDPSAKPSINPNYFDIDFDMKVLVAMAKYVRNTWVKTNAYSPIVEDLNFPGPEVQTDADWETFIKNNFASQGHTTGTSSMLPREDGGVVDPTLKVYGTSNVRIVDLSVMPQQFSGHPQALAYLIGEKGADLIKKANH